MSEPLYRLTLGDARAAIRDRSLRSEDYVRALLERIAATDANVQAWAHLDAEHALAQARAADAKREAQLRPGPIDGVPIGVKDIVATAGEPTQMGSPIYAGANAIYDAECVLRLKRAGGLVMGKTVTTEFAFMQPGKTRNPWNAAHTPGGSSSGSAAAVALGQVPAAIGTQTNGSIIRPAAYCGVVGFKPSLDALPFGGVKLFSPSLDTLGVFARNVDDCAVLASALAGDKAIAATIAGLDRLPRLGLLADFPWVATSSEQRAAIDAAVDTLRASGAIIMAISLPERCREAHLVHRRIMLREGADQLGELQQRERARMSTKLNSALDEGRGIDATAYAGALSRRLEIIAVLSEWMAPFDAIMTPPAPAAAPGDLRQTGDAACCTLWSLAGFPAVTLPVALAPNGLPLGLQISAPQGRDERLLAIARWCEKKLPFEGLV
ncbi:MAG: amidase [Betaproteobacteria bacterium]|nr:MAG: amidase [Betaproteobacteria bacterium]